VPEKKEPTSKAPARLPPPEAGPRRECLVIEESVPEHENARASAQAARAAELAEAIEEEIGRIREARPYLSSRIDKAAGLLVSQLSLPTQTRPIKVRIGVGGTKRGFLVASASSPGATYSVDCGNYGCTCPDAQRRGIGCKHSIACWCLKAVDSRARWRRRQGCKVCNGSGWIHLGEEIIDSASGEVTDAVNVVRCSRCGGVLSEAFVRRWLESQRWIYARSRPNNPHSYCLRREAGDTELFEKVVEHIREFGHPYPWWGRVYRQYVCGSHAYWSMGAPLSETELINRKSLEQVRLDQLTNKGGGAIVWPWLHKDVEAERAEMRRQRSAQDELGGA
jgi:hypothetical protein